MPEMPETERNETLSVKYKLSNADGTASGMASGTCVELRVGRRAEARVENGEPLFVSKNASRLYGQNESEDVPRYLIGTASYFLWSVLNGLRAFLFAHTHHLWKNLCGNGK